MDGVTNVNELHSIRSAARYCKVAPGTVRNWLLTGLLAYRRSNNRIYIRQDELDEAYATRLKARAENKARKHAIKS